MKKNTASQKIGCQMVSASDGSAFTSSVTVYVTGDAGTQAIGSVSSGACTHEGNGYHTYAPAQAETNYDLIGFTFIGTGAIPTTVQVFTDNGDTAIAAIKTVTDHLATAIELDGSVYRFTTNALEQSPSLGTVTCTELTTLPAASPTLAQAMSFLYMTERNKHTVTADTRTIYNEAGTAVFEQPISDDGITFTRQEYANA